MDSFDSSSIAAGLPLSLFHHLGASCNDAGFPVGLKWEIIAFGSDTSWLESRSEYSVICSFEYAHVCKCVLVSVCMYIPLTQVCTCKYALLQTIGICQAFCKEIYQAAGVPWLFSLRNQEFGRAVETPEEVSICWTQSHPCNRPARPCQFCHQWTCDWWIKAWIQSLESISSFTIGKKKERGKEMLGEGLSYHSFGFLINLPSCPWCPCALLPLRV